MCASVASSLTINILSIDYYFFTTNKWVILTCFVQRTNYPATLKEWLRILNNQKGKKEDLKTQYITYNYLNLFKLELNWTHLIAFLSCFFHMCHFILAAEHWIEIIWHDMKIHSWYSCITSQPVWANDDHKSLGAGLRNTYYIKIWYW